MPHPHASLHLPRCDEVSERLSEFLDGELEPVEAHEVALHLAICEACAQLLVELAETVQALHGLRPGVLGTRSQRSGRPEEERCPATPDGGTLRA
jgi:anti-sigma factor RsiW